MKSILVVDDEKAIRESLGMIFKYASYDVHFAEDGISALVLRDTTQFDLVLLDIKMAGIDGLEVLRKMKQAEPDLPVVMISGHGTIETAVEATRLGAFDFLQKPLDKDKLLITVRNALEKKQLLVENKLMKEKVEEKYTILGESKGIRDVLAIVERVAPTDARVLITGENGVGKELVARELHRRSKRSARAFVEVNCAAIPNELIESELFGHERGSFTGATTQRLGKFEQADGGTLFLDEIGDMSKNAQAKVLRALEDGKIERVGGNKQISVAVRVIAATNKNLNEAIRQGTFREDLFHRLNVIPVKVPPLRDRADDIPILAMAFAKEVCQRNGMKLKKFTEASLNTLKEMQWPGNVRELRNTVERYVIMAASDMIDVPPPERKVRFINPEFEDLFDLAYIDFKVKSEVTFIRRHLGEHGENITKTAEALKMQRSHLYSRMRKLGMLNPDEGAGP